MRLNPKDCAAAIAVVSFASAAVLGSLAIDLNRSAKELDAAKREWAGGEWRTEPGVIIEATGKSKRRSYLIELSGGARVTAYDNSVNCTLTSGVPVKVSYIFKEGKGRAYWTFTCVH